MRNARVWLNNLLGGMGSALDIWPAPVRHQLGAGFLDHSIEEDFRRDLLNVAGDMNAALARAREEVPYVGARTVAESTVGPTADSGNKPVRTGQRG